MGREKKSLVCDLGSVLPAVTYDHIYMRERERRANITHLMEK